MATTNVAQAQQIHNKGEYISLQIVPNMATLLNKPRTKPPEFSINKLLSCYNIYSTQLQSEGEVLGCQAFRFCEIICTAARCHSIGE